MAAKPTTPTTGNTPSRDFGPLSTGLLLAMLFDRAAPHLDTKELTWIAEQSPECTSFHGRNLADTLMTLGCMVNTDQGKWLEDSDALSKMLFALSHQASVLAEMGEIADNARHHLKRRAASLPHKDAVPASARRASKVEG